jgi:ferric-dicitrate binding protein FerR (iron transport regulator)
MQSLHDHTADYEMMARLLSGEMGPEEERKARKGIRSDSLKEAVFDQLSTCWNMMETTDRPTPADTDKAWEKLSGRLEADGLLPAPAKPKIRTLFPAWAGWAASLLILAVAGILLHNRTPDPLPLLTENISPEKQTLVQFLEDGSVVYLADNARLAYPETFGESERKVVLEGEAFFDVSPKADQAFLVETRAALVEVLGTSFNVKATGQDAFELFVEEGVVRVSSRTDPAMTLLVEPGEMLSVTGNRFEKSTVSDNAPSAWKTTRMHFKDETLDNILRVINKNYHAGLRLAEGQEGRRLTVTFYQNNLPTIIELISLSMDLQAVELPDSTILLRPAT